MIREMVKIYLSAGDRILSFKMHGKRAIAVTALNILMAKIPPPPPYKGNIYALATRIEVLKIKI